MSINNEWGKVKEFHQKFNHPVSERPVLLSAERVQKRYKWMKEEIDEFNAANSIVDQADAMIDVIYFALGTLVEMGIPPANLFSIVHEANIAKLWEDGLPHYDEDGKTIKSPKWKDPSPALKEIIIKL